MSPSSTSSQSTSWPEPLPDEFSASRLRRSLVALAAGRGGLAADFIAHRTVAFFLLTSLANVGFLALGGVALATGVLHGSPGLALGLIPAVAAALALALALGARQLAGALARRSMRARLAAAADAAGDGVDEALRLLRTGDPAILDGASGYMLFDVAMLGVCFAAFGNDVPPAGVLLVAYIIGQLGSLIAIPGGIGGVDAGLIGTRVLCGVDATDAAVAVSSTAGCCCPSRRCSAYRRSPCCAVGCATRRTTSAHPANRWKCSAGASCGDPSPSCAPPAKRARLAAAWRGSWCRVAGCSRRARRSACARPRPPLDRRRAGGRSSPARPGYAPTTVKPASGDARRCPVPAGSTSTSPADTSNASPCGPPSSIVARPATTASASCDVEWKW